MDVYCSDEFTVWFQELEEAHKDSVGVAVLKLEARGIDLGYPVSSAIQNCKYAFRELRIKSHGHALRVIYAFDPARDAYLILGGDKTGVKQRQFYDQLISRCEQIWAEYLSA